MVGCLVLRASYPFFPGVQYPINLPLLNNALRFEAIEGLHPLPAKEFC